MLEQLQSLGKHPDGYSLFDLNLPQHLPVRGMISIPHAGDFIPDEFRSFLNDNEWAFGQDLDFKAHELIDSKALCEAGIVILKSNIHRVACDLNRYAPKAIFAWPKTSQGIPLLSSSPSPKEKEQLLRTYHTPYFKVILGVLTAAHKGLLSFIDLHSMPSFPTDYHFQQNPNQEKSRPDFCLSDQNGKTCSPHYIHNMKKSLENYRHHVLINRPYLGGYITEFTHPHVPHNIQIEIKRGIYMNEEKQQLTEKAAILKKQLTESLLKQFKEFS